MVGVATAGPEKHQVVLFPFGFEGRQRFAQLVEHRHDQLRVITHGRGVDGHLTEWLFGAFEVAEHPAYIDDPVGDRTKRGIGFVQLPAVGFVPLHGVALAEGFDPAIDLGNEVLGDHAYPGQAGGVAGTDIQLEGFPGLGGEALSDD
ncbi:hypothetical protein D3C78_1017290 [compost metagenome]